MKKKEGSLEKHQQIQDNLEDRLKSYGYKTYTNTEYYIDKRTLGEVDVMAFKVNCVGEIDRITLYEIKSGMEGSNHARHQLRRARDYFSVNGGIPINLVYVTADRHGALKARRIR